MKENTGTEVA